MALILRQFLQRSVSLPASSSRLLNAALTNHKASLVKPFAEQTRCQSTKPIYDFSSLDSGDQTILKARQLLRMKKLPKYIISKSSGYLYEACTDKVDIERFINHLNMEDTFSTWFRITRLHVWMILVRAMKEAKPNNEILRNEVIARMWDDTTARIDKLGMIKASQKKVALRNYYDEFNATMLALDEGLLTDDITLAGALWRNLFGMTAESLHPQNLDLVVGYVRAQLEHIHRTVRTDQLLFQGSITWKPYPPLMV